MSFIMVWKVVAKEHDQRFEEAPIHSEGGFPLISLFFIYIILVTAGHSLYWSYCTLASRGLIPP